jgi:Tfp pilus assembly protein FimT
MGKRAGRGETEILRAGSWIRRTGFTQPLRAEAGFTFIELIIILFILSFALLFVIPKFKNIFPETHLSSSARRIAGEITLLYHEAGLSGRKCRLNFDLDEDKYWSAKETLQGEMERPEGNLAGVKGLLPGVSFQDVVTGTKKVEEGTAYIDFSPYGLVEPVIIHLVNSEGEKLSITVNCFTGRAEIRNGYIEEK